MMNFTTTIPITENNRDYLLLLSYEGILILSILILFLQRALKKITIVAFNFAGLQKNPLEFCDDSELLKMAEDIMKIDPTWNLSADKETKDRYSIIYDKTIPFGLSDENLSRIGKPDGMKNILILFHMISKSLIRLYIMLLLKFILLNRLLIYLTDHM